MEISNCCKKCFFNLAVLINFGALAVVCHALGNVLQLTDENHEIVVAVACLLLMIAAREEVVIFDNLRQLIISVIMDPGLTTIEERSYKQTQVMLIGENFQSRAGETPTMHLDKYPLKAQSTSIRYSKGIQKPQEVPTVILSESSRGI
jgi:hypothetical protein